MSDDHIRTIGPITRRARAALLAVCVGMLSLQSLADDLAPGAAAPDFALAGSDGKLHRLADYRGTALVLAWFPKAFTGG